MVVEDARRALSRTIQLIADDVFHASPGDDPELEGAIFEGLRQTTIRIASDHANLSSLSGQTAVVTLALLVAQMGVNVVLDVPDVELVAPQPPLGEGGLRTSLVELGADLVPGVDLGSSPGEVDLTFLVGSTPGYGPTSLRLTGTDWTCRLALDARGTTWTAGWPLGAFAGAGAAAAEAFRAGLLRISSLIGRPLPIVPGLQDLSREVLVDLSVPSMPSVGVQLGDLDVVSGGAITTSALFCLSRLPGLTANVRVFEDDTLDISNLNRYPLGRFGDIGRSKIAVLQRASRDGLTISGVQELFDSQTSARHGPLAGRILVGVDDIPSRWIVQRQTPGWLCVGATSHLWHVVVTTHAFGDACAGCAHPRDEALPGDIPTISFVSFWAGLMQARALLVEAAGLPASALQYHVSPAGLYGPRGILAMGVAPREDCPVQCAASRGVGASASSSDGR